MSSGLERQRREIVETYARLFAETKQPPAVKDLECLLREWEFRIRPLVREDERRKELCHCEECCLKRLEPEP